MKEFKHGKTTLLNCDCMEYMAGLEDNAFDLAVVDPPYGIARFGNRVCDADRVMDSKINKWDKKPSTEYFDELFRVSKFSVIWGANNFILPTTEYFIIWDKKQTVPNFASAEYAWTNHKMPAKVFRYSVHQMMSERKLEGGKQHPTQKPVALYKWIFANYAKPGQRILDTHGGSFSSAIAAHYSGLEFVGMELDPDYYTAAVERFKKETRQIDIFQT